MILESLLEENLKESLKPILDDTIQVITSRQTTDDEGELIAEEDDKTHIVVIASSFRQHDAFSISVISVSCNITVVTRTELDPTGISHEALIEQISDKLSRWHFYGTEMCDALTSDKFLCSELRMEGGTGRVLDKSNSVWTETLNFTVRGSEIF